MERGRFPLVSNPPFRARSLWPHMSIGLNFRIVRNSPQTWGSVTRPNSPPCCCGSVSNGVCGGADYVEDAFRLGEHRHMAAVEFVGGCAHALGHSALQIGLNGAVILGDDVPAG